MDGDNLFIRNPCEVHRWHLLDETMMPEFQTRLWFFATSQSSSHQSAKLGLAHREKNGAGGNWVHIILLSCRIMTRWKGSSHVILEDTECPLVFSYLKGEEHRRYL